MALKIPGIRQGQNQVQEIIKLILEQVLPTDFQSENRTALII